MNMSGGRDIFLYAKVSLREDHGQWKVCVDLTHVYAYPLELPED
jgi:hypothetical protein